MQNKGIILIWVAMALFSCAPKALREAKDVVAQADNLWKEGQMYADSARLAQSYATLHAWRYVCADEYAHACYHYGRLLREKDNPVEAMRRFIDATHARTREYHILGRVYSNIGDIAHLAGEFPLAYDMYERSGQMYLRNGDSLLYYYDLNNMAFELAEQGKKEESGAIIQTAERGIDDNNLLCYKLEIQAVACKKAGQYDSVLHYTSQLLNMGYNISSVLLNRAQAYSLLGEKDSAVHYANLVLSSTNEIYEQTNALYILTNDDNTKEIADVRETASERADSQKIIEKRKSKLAQAVQLLEQDLHRKPDWRGYVVILLVFVCITSFVIFALSRRKRKEQMQTMVNEQANNTVESIKRHIDTTDINHTLHWKDYTAMKTDANLYMNGIVNKLETYHLNEVEIRFCILTLLDFPLRKIAETIHYSYPSAIKTLKKRTADKLSTTPPKMKDFLLHLPPNS